MTPLTAAKPLKYFLGFATMTPGTGDGQPSLIIRQRPHLEEAVQGGRVVACWGLAVSDFLGEIVPVDAGRTSFAKVALPRLALQPKSKLGGILVCIG